MLHSERNQSVNYIFVYIIRALYRSIKICISKGPKINFAKSVKCVTKYVVPNCVVTYSQFVMLRAVHFLSLFIGNAVKHN